MPDWLEQAPTGPTSGADVINLIQNLTNWLFVVFITLAVIMLVWAGFQFIASHGDPQNVAKARAKLTWAVIGIGAALVSGGIPVVVKSLLGV